ncbi:MAG: plastocyanin/azurin family copper-binding protein [Dehalococcoidia bacterium]
MRLRTWLFILPLMVVLLLATCGPATTPTATPEPVATAPPPPPAAGASADIQDFAFKLQEITVAGGTTVNWTNRDAAAHTVSSTSTPGGQGFDSGTLSQAQTFSVTFTVPGTYQYQCNIHPYMKGTIVVTE